MDMSRRRTCGDITQHIEQVSETGSILTQHMAAAGGMLGCQAVGGMHGEQAVEGTLGEQEADNMLGIPPTGRNYFRM